ncbi:MAG TPA: stage II sporulation protein M, partial [Patescibacteria group bacterium]|nr:stage II sporulation protein M [Patescibacteria group bacterium]
LPHGVIELFAFFLATSYGLWLGNRFLQKIQHREPLRPHVKNALIVFLRVIVPLLFVAALIETFVTPHFMGVRF